MRDFGHQSKFRLLRRFRNRIAIPYRAEAALRGQRHLFARKEFARLVDALENSRCRLELGALGRDQTQHHALVAWNFAQRLERTGTPVVVLEQKPREVSGALKNLLRYRFVPAFADVITLVVPAAQMEREADATDVGNRVDNVDALGQQ